MRLACIGLLGKAINSLDHAGRFTLTDEGGSCRNNGLSTTDVEGLQEEPSKLGNEPLENIVVIHHLCKGDEEDNCTESIGKEPEFLISIEREPMSLIQVRPLFKTHLENSLRVEEEGGTVVSLCQEV